MYLLRHVNYCVCLTSCNTYMCLSVINKISEILNIHMGFGNKYNTYKSVSLKFYFSLIFFYKKKTSYIIHIYKVFCFLLLYAFNKKFFYLKALAHLIKLDEMVTRWVSYRVMSDDLHLPTKMAATADLSLT